LSWWTQKLVEVLLKYDKEEITIATLSKETAIKQSDIVMVLERLNLLRYHQGQHVIFAEKKYLEDLYKLAGRPPIPVKRECLHWTPYIPPTSKPATT
jgi:histone acetyltransferase HTATIP/histone acetyltransferase MYST1